MNIAIIGGSGLLGACAVRAALQRGLSVTALSRSGPRPEDRSLPVSWVQADIHEMPEDALRTLLDGKHAVVYALGLDDRNTLRYPAWPTLYHDHVTSCCRLLRTAKQCGVRSCVVYGSYFTRLNALKPELELTRHHVYIRSREAQKTAALALNDKDFSVSVLEIPYVFGSVSGRIPVWSTMIFPMLRPRWGMGVFFGAGGTAVATTRQIAAATLNIVTQGIAGDAWPIAAQNVSWRDLAATFQAISGERRRILWLKPGLFRTFGYLDVAVQRLRGKQRGLHTARLADLQFSNAFLDPAEPMASLGYPQDDYQPAFAEMIRLWSNHGAGRA